MACLNLKYAIHRQMDGATGYPAMCTGKAPGMSEKREPNPPDPHEPLNNPADEPDPTEWPDPYDKRPAPPPPPEDLTSGEEYPHPPVAAETTSNPHPSQDPEAGEWEGPKRDK